jgi:hypothetical protein
METIRVVVGSAPVLKRYSSGANHLAGFRGALIRPATSAVHWHCLHTHKTRGGALECARGAIAKLRYAIAAEAR